MWIWLALEVEVEMPQISPGQWGLKHGGFIHEFLQNKNKNKTKQKQKQNNNRINSLKLFFIHDTRKTDVVANQKYFWFKADSNFLD